MLTREGVAVADPFGLGEADLLPDDDVDDYGEDFEQIADDDDDDDEI